MQSECRTWRVVCPRILYYVYVDCTATVENSTLESTGAVISGEAGTDAVRELFGETGTFGSQMAVQIPGLSAEAAAAVTSTVLGSAPLGALPPVPQQLQPQQQQPAGKQATKPRTSQKGKRTNTVEGPTSLETMCDNWMSKLLKDAAEGKTLATKLKSVDTDGELGLRDQILRLEGSAKNLEDFYSKMADLRVNKLTEEALKEIVDIATPFVERFKVLKRVAESAVSSQRPRKPKLSKSDS